MNSCSVGILNLDDVLETRAKNNVAKREEDDPLMGADIVWKERREEDDPLMGADIVW